MSNLLDYLEERKEDRGFMANLRCALVDTKRMRAYPYLARFGGVGENPKARVVQTIAGLYALHPNTTNQGNVGDACRCLCGPDEKPWDEKPGPIAKRLQHLLAAERDEICDRVVRVVLRAKSQEIPINYEQLENDLLYWGDKVKNRWAMSFWAPKDNKEVQE